MHSQSDFLIRIVHGLKTMNYKVELRVFKVDIFLFSRKDS